MQHLVTHLASIDFKIKIPAFVALCWIEKNNHLVSCDCPHSEWCWLSKYMCFMMWVFDSSIALYTNSNGVHSWLNHWLQQQCDQWTKRYSIWVKHLLNEIYDCRCVPLDEKEMHTLPVHIVVIILRNISGEQIMMESHTSPNSANQLFMHTKVSFLPQSRLEQSCQNVRTMIKMMLVRNFGSQSWLGMGPITVQHIFINALATKHVLLRCTMTINMFHSDPLFTCLCITDDGSRPAPT
jgi:hypothetical protein